MQQRSKVHRESHACPDGRAAVQPELQPSRVDLRARCGRPDRVLFIMSQDTGSSRGVSSWVAPGFQRQTRAAGGERESSSRGGAGREAGEEGPRGAGEEQGGREKVDEERLAWANKISIDRTSSASHFIPDGNLPTSGAQVAVDSFVAPVACSTLLFEV